ncbi:MAG: hypothetical protein HYR67_11875 [Bacteroidetes bacterium]|nr:hypothetical protein [Bacteroidota bacterium]MBI3765128.1 hypothetical protein [Ignavibacteriales bacterium]
MSNDNHRVRIITLLLSIAALLVSALTAYWNFLRPVQLDIAISPHLLIANTIGGLPQAVLQLSFRGIGSSEQALVVHKISMQVENLASHKKVELEGISTEKNLPLMISGKSIESQTFIFKVNEPVPDRHTRYTAWCTSLAKVVPKENQKHVDELLDYLKVQTIGSKITFSDQQENPSPTTQSAAKAREALQRRQMIDEKWEKITERFAQMTENLARQQEDESQVLNDHVNRLLSTLEPAAIIDILFLTAGRYKIAVSVYNPFDEVLKTESLYFDIDPILAQALQQQFANFQSVGFTKQ